MVLEVKGWIYKGGYEKKVGLDFGLACINR